jgi:hypothetical protein
MTIERRQREKDRSESNWRTRHQLCQEYGTAEGNAAFDALVEAGSWRPHPSCPAVVSMGQVFLETESSRAKEDEMVASIQGQFQLQNSLGFNALQQGPGPAILCCEHFEVFVSVCAVL